MSSGTLIINAGCALKRRSQVQLSGVPAAPLSVNRDSLLVPYDLNQSHLGHDFLDMRHYALQNKRI